jgi:phage regulator Rha-like protein
MEPLINSVMAANFEKVLVDRYNGLRKKLAKRKWHFSESPEESGL